MDAFNYAAKYLPEGYSIRIELEKGAASSTLYDPDGNSLDFCMDDDTFGNATMGMVDFACVHADTAAPRRSETE